LVIFRHTCFFLREWLHSLEQDKRQRLKERIDRISVESHRLLVRLDRPVHVLHGLADKVAPFFETGLIFLVGFVLVGHVGGHQFEKREDRNELDEILVKGDRRAKTSCFEARVQFGDEVLLDLDEFPALFREVNTQSENRILPQRPLQE